MTVTTNTQLQTEMLTDDKHSKHGRYPVAKASWLRRTKHVNRLNNRLHSVINTVQLDRQTLRVFVQVKRHGKQRLCRFNCST